MFTNFYSFFLRVGGKKVGSENFHCNETSLNKKTAGKKKQDHFFEAKPGLAHELEVEKIGC